MLNSGDWTAIGTLALAGVTIWVSTTARRHDDEKRAEDRAADAAKRAEDRARDDRLRQEARDETERRERDERIAREDFEARQVLVVVEEKEHAAIGHDFNRRITLSAPHSYPIKWVEGRLIIPSNQGLGSTDFGHGGDEPYIDEQRIYYSFWAHVPERAPGAAPIMRWVDWHGNRYYQYKHYTRRFGQNTDWLKAAQELDLWVRTGPKPDENGTRSHGR